MTLWLVIASVSIAFMAFFCWLLYLLVHHYTQTQ